MKVLRLSHIRKKERTGQKLEKHKQKGFRSGVEGGRHSFRTRAYGKKGRGRDIAGGGGRKRIEKL